MWWKTESRAKRERKGGEKGRETKKKPRILQMNRETRDIWWTVPHWTSNGLFLNSYRQGDKRLVGSETGISTCWAFGKLRTIDQHRSVLVTNTLGQFRSWGKCKLWCVNRLQVCKNASELVFKCLSQQPLSIFLLQHTVDAVNYD